LCDKKEKCFEKAKWSQDRTHKDSLEVIKLSLLRNLTPKPVQKRERKKGRHMQFLKDSKSEAVQNKTPALLGGMRWVRVDRGTVLLKETAVLP